MAARGGARAEGIVAILGADSYRAEAALEQVLARTIGEDRGDALQVFRGDEATWARVIDGARTGSLFVPRRVVVVRAADQLKGDGEEMLAFLEAPPPDVTLALLAVKPDRRKTPWRRICETATVVDVEPLKGRALRSYVEAELRRRSLRLTDEAQDELIERVGQDLRRLMGEVEKLEAYADKGATVGADEVARLLGRGLAQPLYKLSDAMMARRGAEVLFLIHELLEEGESPQRILATLHRTIRTTRGARGLLAERAPREEIISRLKILPFKVGDVMDAARRWSDEELRGAIRTLAQADRRMKTGCDARVALAALVAETCRPVAPRPGRSAR